jgi:hypothetical protein
MYGDDERGQSIQIGAVLLFGALIVALAGYQAFVVPQQNERVEFSHSQTVQDDMGELRNALVSATGEASTRSVSVTLGTRYPPRLVAVNPGPPSGTIRTDGTGDPGVTLEVVNAKASGETGDFWDGTARSYRTGSLVYRPNYNLYGEAPTTSIENTVAVNEFGTGTVPLSGQAFVDGNRISLVALNGSLGRTRAGATSVDVRPVSVATTTVSVTDLDSSSPVRLRLPTRLSEDTWRELLDEELNGPDGHVSSVSVVDTGARYDTLVVTLETGEEYTLELAKVGVGTGVTGTDPAYLTDVAGNGSTVPEAGTDRLVVEVRDSYDNPVSGVSVSASASVGTLAEQTVTTDGDGQAVFRYEAPGSVDALREATVEFSYEGVPGADFDGDAPENVTMTVDVQNTVVSGGGGGGSPYDVSWTSPTGGADSQYTLDVGTQGSTLDMTAIVENTTLGNRTIDGADVDFAVNDSTVGTVTPGNDTSGPGGKVSTTFTAQENGLVRVYVTTDGGASDYVDVSVINAASGTVIDSFEDGNLDEYSGATNQYAVTTAVSADGSYSIKAESIGNAEKVVYSDGAAPALLTYPRESDTFAYEFQPGSFSSQDYEAGIEFGDAGGGDRYSVAVVETGGNNDDFELQVGNGATTATDGTFQLSTGTWYEVSVDWGSNDVTVTVTDASGTQIASATVSTRGDNGDYFGFVSQGGTTYYDNARVTSSGGASSVPVPVSQPESAAAIVVSPQSPGSTTGLTVSSRRVDRSSEPSVVVTPPTVRSANSPGRPGGIDVVAPRLVRQGRDRRRVTTTHVPVQ